MGIETRLTIETFEYLDYQRAHSHNVFFENDDDFFCNDDDDDDYYKAPEDYPRIPVRGLAAATDIAEGVSVVWIVDSQRLHSVVGSVIGVEGVMEWN